MRKPILHLALTAALGMISGAAAHAGCTTVAVSAGAKVCTSPAESANDMICTSGTTPSEAKFQVYWGSTSNVPTVTGGSNEIAGSGTPVSSFSANFDAFSDPSLFPGFFVICGVNKTSGSISVTLCLHPDVATCPPPGQ